MKRSRMSKTLLRDLFREEALLIGGLAATHKMSDDVIWSLCRNLDLIRARFLRRLDQCTPKSNRNVGGSAVSPHPAVQELLRKVEDR